MKSYTKFLITTTLAAGVLTACEQSIQDQIKEKREAISELKKEITELEKLDTTKVIVNKIPVAVQKVDTSTFDSYFSVQGVINSNENISIIPEISGQITSVKVKEGQKVRRGQLLVTLDTKVMRSQLRELEKSYELAEELFRKQENLRKQDIGTEIQYLEAKNRKESLEQQIASLKTRISKASIKAPISGKVDLIYSHAGEMASPTAPLVRIVNLSNVYVEAEISEAYLGKINLHDDVKVQFPSLGKDYIDAKVIYVGNFINAKNRTFKLHVGLPTSSERYLPNLLAIVRLQDQSLKGSIVVPSNVVRDDGKDYFVYTMDKDSISHKQLVKVGAAFNNKSVIDSGLVLGQQLIVKGHSLVSDSSIVTVKNK